MSTKDEMEARSKALEEELEALGSGEDRIDNSSKPVETTQCWTRHKFMQDDHIDMWRCPACNRVQSWWPCCEEAETECVHCSQRVKLIFPRVIRRRKK